MDEIERNGQAECVQNRLIPEILRYWTATKMLFVRFADFVKANYTFR